MNRPVAVIPARATVGSQTNTLVTTAATARRMTYAVMLLLSRRSVRDTKLEDEGLGGLPVAANAATEAGVLRHSSFGSAGYRPSTPPRCVPTAAQRGS